MRTMIEVMGWWAGMVLPVVLGLTLVSWLLIRVIASASWRFQNRVLMGGLGAFVLVLIVPLFPQFSFGVEMEVAALVEGFRVLPNGLEIDHSFGNALAVIAILWVVGGMVALVRLAREHRGLSRLIADSVRCDGRVLEEWFGTECLNQLKRHRVQVWLCEDGISPCCTGIFRKRLLLPNKLMEQLDRQELELVVRHELVHLSGDDVSLLYGQRLMEALYWWNPVVVCMSSRFTVVREGLCDESMLDQGMDPQAYANVLVRLSELVAVRRAPVMAGVPLYQSLKERVERILSKAAPRRRAPMGVVMGAGLCLGVVLAVTLIGDRKSGDEIVVGSNEQSAPVLESGGFEVTNVRLSDARVTDLGGEEILSRQVKAESLEAVKSSWGDLNSETLLLWGVRGDTTESGKIKLSDSFYVKPTVKVRKEFHDDPSFAREYLERGLEELRQTVPGSIDLE
ncbi:MAG: beta-lactamase regulating signal transducer with metallopeptidase domain [Verrucomicrobiales bacterium]|jgi:beta-lactamase regulating signal transducer with metallopeptidase domain